jgi:hypothetical protein
VVATAAETVTPHSRQKFASGGKVAPHREHLERLMRKTKYARRFLSASIGFLISVSAL